MQRHLVAAILATCFFFCLADIPLRAGPPQISSNTATENSISGTVLDSTHAALPLATVRLLDAAGARIAVTLTDQKGNFSFREAAAAGYIVEASLTGFETASAPAASSALQLVLAIAPVRESIVVSATRTQAPTSQLAASVTVIGKDEIADRQALSVGDLLQSATSAIVTKSGGLGTVTTLFVRGGESNYNKVLLDGIPLNEPGGDFDFSNLLPENFERIEVVRGPQSALFGTDAMASVVQLFTARGENEGNRPHFSVSAEGGKNSTWKTQAAVSGQVKLFDYSLDWARLATDNQVLNNVFQNSTASGNFGFALGANTELRAILRGNLGRTGTPGQTAFEPPDHDAYYRRGDGFAGVTLRNQTASFLDQRFTYTFAQTRRISRDLIADPDYTPQFEEHVAPPPPFQDYTFDSLANFRRNHAAYQADLHAGSLAGALGQNTFTFAFDWDREEGTQGDRSFGDPLVRSDRDNYGWTIQHQAVWSRVFLTNSLRVEDNGSFGTVLVPRDSIAYAIRQPSASAIWGATKLKFNFGLGVKEPTFIESFSPSPFFLGNPNLEPQRARSIDFGVEQRLWRDRAKVELNWFDNRFRDQVAFATLPSNPQYGSFFNIGRTKAKGAEVVAEIAPAAGLRIDGSYTFLDSAIVQSQNLYSPVYQVGEGLLRRPRHSGSIRLLWDWRRLNITSSAVFVGRSVDSDFASLVPPLTSNPGYTKWDLAWSYRTAYRVTYFGVAENLLNESYMEKLGYPALKLTYRAGVRVSF